MMEVKDYASFDEYHWIGWRKDCEI